MHLFKFILAAREYDEDSLYKARKCSVQNNCRDDKVKVLERSAYFLVLNHRTHFADIGDSYANKQITILILGLSHSIQGGVSALNFRWINSLFIGMCLVFYSEFQETAM